MKKTTTGLFLDTAFAAALLIKVFSAGFSYFCVLDDYVQYGCYPLYDNLSRVYFGIGTASNRPLAAFFDPAVWGAFFPNMVFALLILCALLFLSAKLFDRCFTMCGIAVTPFFYAVYLLLPLGFEGTYWISASSRIVVGLFFTALTVYLLITYIKERKAWQLLLYAVSSLASFGFYESVTVLSGLVQGLIILKFAFDEKQYKRLWLLAIPALCTAAVLVYYKLAAHIGALGSRAAEFSVTHIGARLGELFSQFGYIFTAGLYRTTAAGFLDGLKILMQNGVFGIVISILILCVSVLCAYAGGKYKLFAEAKLCVPLGLLLIVLPLLPNILVPDVWLTYRSIVVCLPGFCVLFAPLLALAFQNRCVKTTALFLLTSVFLVGCVNEVHTYKAVSELDGQIVNEVLQHLDDEVLAGKKETVLVLSQEVITPQTSFYKDHVKSVFYTDWAVTGAVRAFARNIKIKTITPVYSLENVDTEGKQVLYMDEFYHVTEETNE